ncbi:MAG: Asp-tRNA(Asn)/Glu-tRNA(Gln) amidotransferase subunit GatC, partial [Candidatus Thiodiazotropha taylori]|nr:Asp-tRNA(Asn)/Glu-tRNA(Gln) amidotransferase subunit GatC [Candidatus Thiodiazotropha taylori]
MSLDRSDVEKIAHLARLALDENQVEGYAAELSNILALVEQLEAADTDNIEPMAHP